MKDKFLEFYIIIIVITSQLCLIDSNIFGVSIKTLIFLFITLLAAAWYFHLIANRKVKPIHFDNSLKQLVLYILLFNMLSLFSKLFTDDYGKIMDIEWEIVIVTLILAYVLLAENVGSHRYYLVLAIAAASLVYVGLLYHYLVNPKWMGPMEYLLQSPQRIAVYLILMTTISTLLYCTSKEKKESTFLLLISGIGYFLLFATGDIISISMIGLLFILNPVIFLPTGELIKRNLHLFFLYFFMLSNMTLVTTYFRLLKVTVSYDLEFSIMIDVVLAVAAIIFLKYAEKLPKNVALSKIILWKIQRIYRCILYLIGMLWLTILVEGKGAAKLLEKYGIQQISTFINEIQHYYTYYHGTFYDVFAEFGWVGFTFFIFLIILIIGELKKNYNKKNELSTIFIMITIIYFIQSLFYSQQLITTPIYSILLTVALNKVPKRGVK